MKNIKLFTIALFASLLLVTASLAQSSTTGTVEGVVTDSAGAVVRNATVTLAGPTMIGGAKSVQTDENGAYKFPNVPPGKYTVSIAEAGGFAAFTRENVEVNLSRSSSVDISLSLKGATASIDVIAGATIDQTQNTTGTNVSTDQFSNFPTQRTVQSLYTIAPTVSRSGLRDASGRERDPSVAGSSGPENNYILDGVNTTDPAFGGSGANLPFEFVQEVEVKTGAYGAEYGKSTGGIFNVITKSGGNEFHGDAFGYFATKGLVRETKNFPNIGAATNGYSEIDAGFDIGGPIKKDKLWFFGAFNPQRRTNYYLTQSTRREVENQVTIPFYAAKVTWAINSSHTFTGSTFGDFTKVEGFLATGALANVSGYGANPTDFNGIQETGGHNYAFRLNSTFTPSFIGEFLGGLHFQRANTLPASSLSTPLVTDAFSILRSNNTVAGITQTGVSFGSSTGNLDYAFSPGGSLQRNFVRQGFGLFGPQTRNRYELSAKFQNNIGKHTLKWGAEWFKNKYEIGTDSTGPNQVFGNPLGLTSPTGDINEERSTTGFRVTNNFFVCTTRGTAGNLTLVCPNATSGARGSALLATPGFTAATGITSFLQDALTQAEFFNNPFLIRSSTRVRDFALFADTSTSVQSFYIQDDFKVTRDLQLNFGVRWDFQQAYGNGGVKYLTLNDFVSNTQPRLGLIWDFTGRGKGKLFVNFARYLETPIPLDVNVRAGSDDTQTDKNFLVNTYSAPNGSTIVPGISGSAGTVNLGAHATPLDPGLKPQTVNEYTAGLEYEIVKDLALGFRGIYRHQDQVIEDGSFDDGNNYFIFNPGRRGTADETTTEDLACGDPAIGCFGPARRYYRALEFTATKRFSNNYQFIASYVFSSLIGNYEGLFRNDNGQSDPNITSLFDLVSLLNNTYGRLPNDRPHQLKFNGSYQTPFKLMLSGNFYMQSGVPFNQLIPHPVYGNNEGFAVPRGTATFPTDAPGGIRSGEQRTPTTWNLDLGLYYPIQLGEKRQLRFQADWFNVFNRQDAITADNTFQINSGASGVPPVPNPFYGRGQIFQFPSALRLGVKFQF